MTRRSHGIVLATLGIASLSWPALAQQDKIGVAAEVNPDVFAQVPEGQKRELLVGHDVIHNEKINTGNGGQAQLLFTDQSTLTVAKNSEVVIDDFVFDPQKQNGNLTATLTTGVFRYVGGKISKQQDVTFLTPTGTVSVRGGIALIKIDGDTITAVFLHGDYLKVTSHGVSQTTNHRNTVIISVGGHVSDPTTASAELIQELTQELQALHLTTYTVANEIFVTGNTLASLINLILPIVPNAISTEPNFIPHSPPATAPGRFITAASPPPSSPPPPPHRHHRRRHHRRRHHRRRHHRRRHHRRRHHRRRHHRRRHHRRRRTAIIITIMMGMMTTTSMRITIGTITVTTTNTATTSTAIITITMATRTITNMPVTIITVMMGMTTTTSMCMTSTATTTTMTTGRGTTRTTSTAITTITTSGHGTTRTTSTAITTITTSGRGTTRTTGTAITATITTSGRGTTTTTPKVPHECGVRRVGSSP